MKRFRHTLLALGILLLILGLIGWVYNKKAYPYGSSHRCSKILAMELRAYAKENDGKFPSSENPKALGLSVILADSPHSFDLVVGKAGDLENARKFYDEHGFLLPEHSSWHYVEGLTINDGEALAWDKIPLDHYGKKTDQNPREVITTGGMVRVIKEKDWESYLDEEEKRGLKR